MILMREDGKRQWAYKGRPLFTFKNDYTPGDIGGLLAQKDARVALSSRHFMPAAVKIENMPFLGPIMVTDKGMSVYTQTRYKTFYGGRETRNGFWYTYGDAKALGTRGCIETCLQTWKPVVAPKNAHGSGFWEVATRPDGTKQWAYKGAPLYTYTGDKQPGDDTGNNRHDVVFGDAEGKIDLSLTGGDRRGASGSGFYWRLVAFFN
jgi:predicted lipoprotein with Yx(FWY)xxD motif